MNFSGQLEAQAARARDLRDRADSLITLHRSIKDSQHNLDQRSADLDGREHRLRKREAELERRERAIAEQSERQAGRESRAVDDLIVEERRSRMPQAAEVFGLDEAPGLTFAEANRLSPDAWARAANAAAEKASGIAAKDNATAGVPTSIDFREVNTASPARFVELVNAAASKASGLSMPPATASRSSNEAGPSFEAVNLAGPESFARMAAIAAAKARGERAA